MSGETRLVGVVMAEEPGHSGDGYAYGGGRVLVVTADVTAQKGRVSLALRFGEGFEALEIATAVAEAIEAHIAARPTPTPTSGGAE